jgi:hypothetical protein
MTIRLETARRILAEAHKFGIRIDTTDGHDLILTPPLAMPRARYASFRQAIIEHHLEIIELILIGTRHDRDHHLYQGRWSADQTDFIGCG